MNLTSIAVMLNLFQHKLYAAPSLAGLVPKQVRYDEERVGG
jgi:hypothetical protein